MKYEKLSKRALGCMYVATALASVIALAVIGAVNWLWIFPKDMDMLKAVSLALVILTLFDALASPISDITDTGTVLMKSALTSRKDTCL